MEGERVESLTAAASVRDPAAEELTLVLVLVSLLTLGLVDAQVIAPLLPQIAKSLGTTDGWVGRTVSAYAIAAASTALLAGPLSDRLGRRQFLVGAGLVVAVGSAAVALTRGFFGFAAGRLVTGAGAGIVSALVVAAIADAVPYERRGRSMSWVASAYTVSPALFVPVSVWVAASFGWRTIYFAFSIAGCLLALTVQRHFREARRTTLARGMRRSYRSFLMSRSTAAGAISAFFVTGGLTGFLLFLSAYLQESIGLSQYQVGLVWLLSAVGGLAGAVGAGHIADRSGKLRIALAGSLGLSCLLLVIPFVRGAFLYVLLALVGVSAAARLAPLQSLVTELVPAESRGAYVALRNTLSQAGNAVTALVAAALYGRGFTYVCFLTAAFGALAFLFLLFVEEPRPGESRS
jgi:predicted MFS family arabinose efflux permease